jgi:hypothetical protein
MNCNIIPREGTIPMIDCNIISFDDIKSIIDDNILILDDIRSKNDIVSPLEVIWLMIRDNSI